MPPKSKPSEDAKFLHKILPNESTKKHVETSAKHQASKEHRDKLSQEQIAVAAGVAARRLLETPRPEEIPKREKAIDAHLGRLARLMERGVDVQERIWESAVSSLIIKPEDIPESYWQQQVQIARDNGLGDVTFNQEQRDVMVSQLQDAQRTGAESWSTYLKQTGDQYPLWFKYYVWNGMSKLGVFDKQKGRYRTRDESTVAPFPMLNPSALAKVYDDLIKYKNGILPDDEDHANRIKNANFNELYSYHLLHEKAIIPTPERAEDVRGEWRHYTEKDIDEITKASEGTPWCIAGTDMARSYTSGGGEFYLFHLIDPETGVASPTACASIRLADGKVVEISGLKGGSSQYLEDALVPEVQDKVRGLPGGDRYIRAFEDKNMLIAMDRKFQEGQDFTDEELRFLYELDRPIEYVDTYQTDPRPKQFIHSRDVRNDLLRLFEDKGDLAQRYARLEEILLTKPDIDIFELIDEVNLPAKDVVSRVIARGKLNELFYVIDKFYGLLDYNEIADLLIKGNHGDSVARNLDKFNGLDHNDIATRLIDAGRGESVAYYLRKFEGLNQDIAIRLIDAREGWSVARNLYKFEGLNQDIATRLIDAEQGWSIAKNLDKFEGINHQDIANRLIKARQGWSIAKNLDKFEGLNHQDIATRLIDAGYGRSVAENLDKFKGLNQDIATRLIDAGYGRSVARNLYKFEGLNQDIATRLIDAGYGWSVAENLNKFEGLNHQDIATRLIKAGYGEDVARNLKNFQGLDEATLKKLEPYLKK